MHIPLIVNAVIMHKVQDLTLIKKNKEDSSSAHGVRQRLVRYQSHSLNTNTGIFLDLLFLLPFSSFFDVAYFFFVFIRNMSSNGTLAVTCPTEPGLRAQDGLYVLPPTNTSEALIYPFTYTVPDIYLQ